MNIVNGIAPIKTPNAIEIRFKWSQRLRILLGQRVHVIFDDVGAIANHTVYVAPNRESLRRRPVVR